jgi:hypothetical protein
MAGQEDRKEKKKLQLQLLEEAFIDRARRSSFAKRPPWTQATSHPDLLPDAAPALREA